MPIDLVLVRHSESEGNVANKLSKRGDDRHFTKEFLNRHSSSWRLTDKGIWQAQKAGKWLKENIDFKFDRFYVSEYIRALETAAYLGLPNAKWFVEFYLRERDWGDLDVMTEKERHKEYAKSLKRREIDSFFWTPPNGESMAQLCLRIDRVLNTLHRECTEKRIIIVCHGEVMWGFRVRLERINQEEYKRLDASKNPFDHIHKCQVLHYSRRHPETNEIEPYLNWMKSICPYEPTLSKNSWGKIQRHSFSNDELMEKVKKVTRMISE